MKKLNLLVTFTLLTIAMSATYAQTTIPNGGFEFWESYETPASWSWSPSNIHTSYMGFPVNIVTVTKDSLTPKSGKFAARLETKPTITGVPPSPGFITLGKFWFSIAPMGGGTKGGIAFNTRPDSVIGYYKSTPIGNDSATIILRMWKGTTMLPNIAYNNIKLPPSATWKKFSFAVFYLHPTNTPDSLDLIFSSSNFLDTSKLEAGSVLYLDDVTFDKKTSIFSNSQNTRNLSVFPNPANEYINIKIDGTDGEARIEILDNSGRLVKATPVRQGVNQVSIIGLPSGSYILRYTDRSATGSGSFIVK